MFGTPRVVLDHWDASWEVQAHQHTALLSLYLHYMSTRYSPRVNSTSMVVYIGIYMYNILYCTNWSTSYQYEPVTLTTLYE